MRAYRYTVPDGYYAGEVEDHGLLPANATHVPPESLEGFIPHWTGEGWELVEDHKGKQGYLDGQPHTIKDYGPPPEGWSDTPPPPTAAEIAAQRRAEILARLAEIDAASVRPLRAIAQGDDMQTDHDKLAVLDAEAVALRTELAELPALIESVSEESESVTQC
ncbi:MAG: hypothetical protein LBC94_03890 [Desulfovibrio sp.]|jgi:hypothetical protein|nr:hypothetical protein [Desulfovibrio sp.]